MHASITLGDAAEHIRAIPAPTAAQIAAIKPGDSIKLQFQCNNSSEAMWVTVTEPGKGTLDNNPLFMPIRNGEEVLYDSRHILSIMKNQW